MTCEDDKLHDCVECEGRQACPYGYGILIPMALVNKAREVAARIEAANRHVPGGMVGLLRALAGELERATQILVTIYERPDEQTKH